MLNLQKPEESWWKRLPAVGYVAALALVGIILAGITMPPKDSPRFASAAEDEEPARTEGDQPPRADQHAALFISTLQRDRDLLLDALAPSLTQYMSDCLNKKNPLATCRVACLLSKYRTAKGDISTLCTEDLIKAISFPLPENCPTCN